MKILEKMHCHYNYVVHATEAADLNSVIGKEFRAKFRIPCQMFEEILQAPRESGLFPNDLVGKSGQKPHPFSLKVTATLNW